MFTRALSETLSIFIAAQCAACNRPASMHPLCHRCALPVPNSPDGRCERCFSFTAGQACPTCSLPEKSPLRFERYLWPYEERVRDALRAMKYRPHLGLARWFGTQLAELGIALFPRPVWTHVVPIPGHPARLARRGFDQSSIFALAIANAIGIKPALNTLSHASSTKAQSDTDHEKRFVNSRTSLTLRMRPIPGARILLVDDVCTTGASSSHAALLLRRAGAAQVDFLCVARAHAWDEYGLARSHLPRSKLVSNQQGT